MQQIISRESLNPKQESASFSPGVGCTAAGAGVEGGSGSVFLHLLQRQPSDSVKSASL